MKVIFEDGARWFFTVITDKNVWTMRARNKATIRDRYLEWQEKQCPEGEAQKAILFSICADQLVEWVGQHPRTLENEGGLVRIPGQPGWLLWADVNELAKELMEKP